MSAEADGSLETCIDELGLGIGVFAHDREAAASLVEYVPDVIQVLHACLP